MGQSVWGSSLFVALLTGCTGIERAAEGEQLSGVESVGHSDASGGEVPEASTGPGATPGAEERAPKVVREREAESIVSIDRSTGKIVVDAADPWWQEVSPQDVLVFDRTNATPNGWMRRVKAVATADEGLVLTSEVAMLTDVVEQDSLSVQADFEPVPVVRALPGVRMVDAIGSPYASVVDKTFALELNDVVVFDADDDHFTTIDQVRLDGDVSFSLSMDLDFDFAFFELEKIHFGTTAKLDQHYDVYAGGAPGKQLPPLATWTLSPIVVNVGALPVVFVPRIDLVVRFDQLGAPLKLATSIDSSAQVEVGADFANGFWIPYADDEATFASPGLDFDVSLGGQVRTTVGPKLSLMVYGLAGPGLFVGPYMRFDADAATRTWNLYGGFLAQLFANFSGISPKFNHIAPLDLADVSALIASGPYPDVGFGDGDDDGDDGNGDDGNGDDDGGDDAGNGGTDDGSSSSSDDDACCEASDAGGCADEAIEACVCGSDSYCCDVSWDALCVQYLEKLACGVCS